ncbi:MAG: hypothetical protein NTU49_07570, partial [Gammaproteobacteria bacterium]|nr:hypothetical protein [Gammaproteobacteria bacterium]
VQCTAMIPKNAKRFVLVDAGLGHTFAEDVYWLAEMAKQGSAVVLTEAYSHGPFSSGFPIFGNNEDMTKAMMKVREGGLIHFFEQHPELAALPVFAELGQSWGGVNQVDSFLQGATSVRVSSTETRAITSCVRVAPALKLSSKKYPDFLPTKLAPVLRHLYRKMGGSWEKWRVATGWPGLPKSRFPHRYGVKREDPRGKWMLEAIKVGLRVSTLPWPHLMDNFDHYARITNNLKAQPSGSAPRTLWALDKDDFELDMTTVTQCALHWSGDDGSGSLMKIDFHNPFWGNNMPQVISAFHNFMDKKEHEQIMPLTYQNAARLGLI